MTSSASKFTYIEPIYGGCFWLKLSGDLLLGLAETTKVLAFVLFPIGFKLKLVGEVVASLIMGF